MQWGTTSAAISAPTRPEFNDKNPNIDRLQSSFTDGEPLLYFNPKVKQKAHTLSKSIIFSLIMLVLASVWGVFSSETTARP